MDITTLVQAVQDSNASDAFIAGLGLRQWRALAPHLARREIHAGSLLIRQGHADQSAYFLEQGNLQVFTSGDVRGRSRIAILRPGSLVGEIALFARVPRSANVEAMTPCVVWALSADEFEKLCACEPVLALQVLRGAGTVLAVRARANLERGDPLV